MTIKERVIDYLTNDLPVGATITPAKLAKNCYCRKCYVYSTATRLMEKGVIKRVTVRTTEGNAGYQRLPNDK